jgi:hypothetical protein
MYQTDFSLSKENFTPFDIPSVEAIVKTLTEKREFEEGCKLGSRVFEFYRNITNHEIR